MVEFKIHYFSNSSNVLHSSQTVLIPSEQLERLTYDDVLEILMDKRKYKSMDSVFNVVGNTGYLFPMTINRVKQTKSKIDIFD